MRRNWRCLRHGRLRNAVTTGAAAQWWRSKWRRQNPRVTSICKLRVNTILLSLGVPTYVQMEARSRDSNGNALMLCCRSRHSVCSPLSTITSEYRFSLGLDGWETMRLENSTHIYWKTQTALFTRSYKATHARISKQYFQGLPDVRYIISRKYKLKKSSFMHISGMNRRVPPKMVRFEMIKTKFDISK